MAFCYKLLLQIPPSYMFTGIQDMPLGVEIRILYIVG